MTEKQLAYFRKYYAENKETILNRNKKWREEHREQVNALAKKYRDKNPEYHAEWQRQNKEKMKVIKARYRKKVALHKKRVKQARFQCRDEKGRFCKDKPLDITPALNALTVISFYRALHSI